ncbi:uncharacterized protein PAC_06228 [Phialocephala subalpina]|uniref:BTB domain-containing protein n=1 Tax=Phialocephala subalpina TaxID=576137 RepID=A0A1L7WUC0_9HELO|nr:uncharacterized protein PAC_06228 [Phialocephala subalpina]
MAFFSSGSNLPVITPSAAEKASNSSPNPIAPESHMAEALSSIFASGKYSDLVVKCKGQQWQVHKAVVCMLSKPIGAAFDRGFMVSGKLYCEESVSYSDGTKEASTGEIDLEDDDPRIVQLMLEYMYKGNLNIQIPIARMSPPAHTVEGNASQYGFPPAQQSTVLQPLSGTTTFPNLMAYQMRINNPSNIYSNPSSMTSVYQPYSYMAYPPPYTSASTMMMYPTPVNAISSSHTGSATVGLVQPNAANNALGSPSNPIVVGNTSLNDISNGNVRLGPASSPAAQPSTDDLSRGLITAAEVYILADKYDVQGLKVLACDKYKALCEYYWNNEHFIESLSIIFDNTPDTNETDILRVVTLDTASLHTKELLRKETFQELCQCRGDIATAVLMASVEIPSSPSNNNGRSFSSGDGAMGSGSVTHFFCPVDASHNFQIWAMPDQYYCHQCGVIRRLN